jgi:hypothetical protein
MEDRKYSLHIDTSAGQEDPGLVETVFKYQRGKFDRKRVLDVMRSIFIGLRCEEKECVKEAIVLIMDEKAFKCKDHQ